MAFLGTLANQINNQYTIGSNTNGTQASINPQAGQQLQYASLGDFAQYIDQSAERKYVEEGFLRKDPYKLTSKEFEILLQEPSATVLVKKKQFSSVGNNFRPDFMDADDKMYYKAMRMLFSNKCDQIAALEGLSKIQKITSAVGSVNDQLVPLIISLSDQLNGHSPANLFGIFGSSNPLSKGDPAQLASVVDRLRTIYAYNTTNGTTAWVKDNTDLFQSQFANGTGTIEITNFVSINTTCSTETGGGNFSFSISDPYELMLITDYDIEKAISDASNSFYNSPSFQFGQEAAEQTINDFTTQLNLLRAQRGAGPISIQVSQYSITNTPVVAVLDSIGTQIVFSYDNTSFASIFSGGAFGGGVTIDPAYLLGGAIAGNEGLNSVATNTTIPGSIDIKSLISNSEVSLFGSLINSVYSKLSMDTNSQTITIAYNDSTNYMRRKLQNNFMGRLIIQPMDVVHFYINTKSRLDSGLLSGVENMFSGAGILQNLNNSLTGFEAAASTLFNPSGNVNFQAEKSAFVGSEFPDNLWSSLRSQFIIENEGTHVFAGLVDMAAEDWVDGKFMVNVRGGDFTNYFKMGKVNFNPGVDVSNGSVYDPLTPFKSNYDTIASTNAFGTTNSANGGLNLLDENLALLSSSVAQNDGLVKHKLGRYAGQPVTSNNIFQDQQYDPISGQITSHFYAPDGLVYKWKDGIGIFTQFGNSSNMNGPAMVGTPKISQEPFAGQDVMNVLSLLITGVPYNFATYFKAAKDFGGFSNDPQSGTSSAASFISSLTSNLQQNNTLWGNFIPFKNLVIDQSSYVAAIQRQAVVTQKNQILDDQLKQLQALNNKALLQGAVSAFSQQSDYAAINNDFLQTKSQINTLQQAINQNISELQSSSLNQPIDTSTEVSSFINSSALGANSQSTSNLTLQQVLRRQINYLTRRMSYNVRANEDKNLFIVDDSYDKDYDIMAYNQALTDGIKLYNNEFASVDQKISYVANLLNLEVFADSQGHIRVRPPQYNKMPSSIFYKMLNIANTTHAQIFPQYIADMCNGKLTSLKTQIEILEDQIRLNCAFLSYITDSSCESFIDSSDAAVGNSLSFVFLSDEISGSITDINSLIAASNPVNAAGSGSIAIQTFNNISQNAMSNKGIFTNSQRYAVIQNSLSTEKLISGGTPVTATSYIANSPRVNTIVNRINNKSGQKINTSDYLITTTSGGVEVQPPIGVMIDVFKVTKDLSDNIKQRQAAIITFYNVIKNTAEVTYIGSNNTLTSLSSLSNALKSPPNIAGNSQIPQIFEHMIEDETFDDYGFGSGTRYIIKRHQIKQMSIQENPPPWTTVQVQGVFNSYAPSDLPQGLNSFAGGGNGLVSAIAIDYDSWRNYGLKEPSTLLVPFLSDPVTQCAPYASMILSRNRKNILQGTVTITGNEYMQAGEVVYIQDNGMLFYINSVTHTFAQGANYTTSLKLSYGHAPGEYIPTVLDMIGKLLYNNKDVGSTVINRVDSSGGNIPMGALVLSPTSNLSNVASSLNLGTSDSSPPNSFSYSNAKIINNILYTASTMLNANSSDGNAQNATLEVRIYYDSKQGAANNNLLSFANSVISILNGSTPPAGNNATVSNQGQVSIPLDPSLVSLVMVDLSDTNNRNSPSQKALDMARNLVNLSSTSSNNSILSNIGGAVLGVGSAIAKDATTNPFGPNVISGPNATDIGAQRAALKKALLSNVVDCWIKVSQQTSSNGK